ncbi:glycosyltransferase [Thermostaphylospora chromogena]|uniref:Glycosyltransferase involved in cell wall bisynthesis n=1 Tax=Thermostaphylospora chromogena TaxID=35622 RepID=A0A1H1E9B3_9ACTN|nr:glycosyltransferase [Thermostaphylospora chromogena]SDQ85352.1 Glycosyltransferase involved in cell wall bisynthesis [Thermostaphylospora chromogena]
MSRRAARERRLMLACLDADTLGGVQRVTHTVAQGLAERGYEVHVVGLHRSTHPFRYVERPAYRRHVIHRVPVRTLSRLARGRADRRLAALLTRIDPGRVIMTSPSVVSRLLPLLPADASAIGHYHGSFEHARDTWHLASIRRHWARLTQAVFLSSGDADRFAEHALLPNTWSIPNPLSGWPAERSDLTARRVLGVGRLEGVKRFDRLITAFAAACRMTREPWELHLIGDGAELSRLRAHAHAEGVADRVVFRGQVPAAAMGAEYRDGSLIALTSEHEGFALVLAEAAAHGVPAVAFDVSGGVRSLVRHRHTGLLVPPGDVEAFAAALARLMNSPDERRLLGAAARAHAEGFRLERVLDAWESLFAHVDR